MDDNRKGWYNIAVGVLCLLAFILLFFAIRNGLSSHEMEIKLPFLVILGIMGLFATLAVVALTFSIAGLSDKTQALGLPEGSVRAVIALSLIVIFAIFSIYLYQSMITSGGENKPSADFAKQVFAVVGTLMTSVSSFYFASRAAATTVTSQRSTPTLVSITPVEVSKAAVPAVVPIKISGTDLQLAKSVKFETTGGKAFQASNVFSNDQSVQCEVKMDPGIAVGHYDLIVTNSDGAVAKLTNGLSIVL